MLLVGRKHLQPLVNEALLGLLLRQVVCGIELVGIHRVVSGVLVLLARRMSLCCDPYERSYGDATSPLRAAVPSCIGGRFWSEVSYWY